MKRLLIALAAAAAVSTASAIITDTQLFEDLTWTNSFRVAEGEDDSELAEYGEVTPSVAVPYPCTGFGDKYLSLDTGDATLWRTNAGDAAYIDMVMQFNPCTEAPTNAPGTKISVYLNSTGNLVVQAGDGTGGSSNYVTSTTLAPGTWARLTVASNGAGFDLFLNGTQIGDTYPSLTGDATICEVGFSGSGKLDDFVARTTDPYYSGDYVARIGTGEFYSTYSEALADALATTTQDAATIITYSNDQTSNGSQSNPYRIADAACLVALQNAVLVNPAVRSLHYVQTGNIDMSAVDGFAGIGTYNSNAASGVPFTGTYDGQGYKISNVKFTNRTYAGIFNQINGATIKNLTCENLGFVADASGEHGCAIVGNGVGRLENLTSMYSNGFSITNTHNVGGIMVRVAVVSGYTTSFNNCTNTANIICDRDKAGGICCFAAGPVTFTNCVNTGNYTLVARSGYDSSGKNGFAGILGYAQDGATVSMKGCINTGAFVNADDLSTAVAGQFFAVPSASATETLVDLGGNQFNVSGGAVVGSAPTAKFIVDGFQYATVDNGVGTTVAQADLAAGNTYTLLADVAASETPVYTFASAGTIAFNTNGYNFAGTVAGSSTVAVSEATEGSVITYTGVAGVAAVNNVAYATFDEAADAVASAPEGQQFVTLLADASVEFDETGISLAVRENGHTLTATATGEIVVTKTVDGSTGLATYATVDGVAEVQGDDNVWKWFGSFADAFTYAGAQAYQPNMKFKVGSDFTPAISSNFGVWTLEFIATTEDPITINLANGNAKLVSTRIKFPTTATLNAVSGNVDSMSGGTLNVPSGVVLELASYATDGSSWNITGLSGSGTIKNDDKSMYYFLGNTQYNLPTRMRESSWCGTLELCGSNTWEAEFNKFANANSKVCFNGLTTPLYGSGNDTVAIELVGSGLTISGEYQSARTYAVGGTITGSGALTLADNTGSLLLSGDTSGFTGSVTVSGSSAAVTFGAATTGGGQRIVIQSGKTATIGEGATWTAANLVLIGELTVNGTLAVNNNCIWCNNGAGVLRYANKDTLPTSAKFAGSWNSKCIIACDPGNKRFVLNDFGNANSTLEIAGDNGVFSALPSTENTGGRAPSINPAVILTANWTVNDGWTGTDYTTTFSKLSGTGNLTVNGSTSGTAAIYYTITELNDYTGTLGGNRGNFTISKVNVATAPAGGARVVATAIGANGSINSDIPLWVGGFDSGDVLEYNADGAYGAGLYVKSSGGTGWVDDYTTVTNQTVAEAYPTLASTALATANAGELTEWAKTNNVDFATAAATIGAAPTLYEEAFLLNCAPTAAEVADEKEDFVLDISVAADGTITVSLPENKKYNGTLQMKGSNDLSTWTNVEGASSSYKFYKYVLSLPTAP